MSPSNMHILEIPVKVFSFERITLAKQVFWEMQSSGGSNRACDTWYKTYSTSATTSHPSVQTKPLYTMGYQKLFRILQENSNLIQ